MARGAERLVNGVSIGALAVAAAWLALLFTEGGGPGPGTADGWPDTGAGTQRVVELEAGRHLLAWHYRPSRVNCDDASPEPPDGFEPRVVDLRTERPLPLRRASDSHYCRDTSSDIQGQTFAEVELPSAGSYLLDARDAGGAPPDHRLAIGPHDQPITDRLGYEDPLDAWPLVLAAAVAAVLGQGLLYALASLPGRGRPGRRAR